MLEIFINNGFFSHRPTEDVMSFWQFGKQIFITRNDVIETKTWFEKIMNQTFDKSDFEGLV